MKTIQYRGVEYTCPFSTVIPRHGKRDAAHMRESIKEKGVREPVKVYFDETLNCANCVLDGEGRLTHAAELDLDVTFDNCGEMTTVQATELSHILNVPRRHLTEQELQKLRAARVRRVSAARAEGKSTRTIAKEVGVSQSQVISDLREASGEQGCSPAPPRVVGTDGKRYSPTSSAIRCKTCQRKGPIRNCQACEQLHRGAPKTRQPSQKQDSGAVKFDDRMIADAIGKLVRMFDDRAQRLGQQQSQAYADLRQRMEHLIASWDRWHLDREKP